MKGNQVFTGILFCFFLFQAADAREMDRFCFPLKKDLSDILLVLDIDISSSSSHLQKPDSLFFKNIVTAATENGRNITLCIGLIGNVKNNTFLRNTFYALPNYESEQIPSQKIKLKKEAMAIKTQNMNQLSVFLNLLNKEISSHSQKGKTDLTDFNAAIKKSALLLNEKNNALMKKYLILISDCEQDLGKKEPPQVPEQLAKIQNLEIQLCGCLYADRFSRFNSLEFESVHGIYAHLLNILTYGGQNGKPN